MADLSNFRVAIIATDGFEDSELVEPKKALDAAGARTDVISPKGGEVQGFKHDEKSIKVRADRTLGEIRPEEYDAVMLPGGVFNADSIRMEPKLQQFLRAMWEVGRPFAVICHAPWELVSAHLAEGRRLTSYYTIQDDMKNAGADWVDEEVVVDGRLVTSRHPGDIPAFNREMLRVFAEAGARAGAASAASAR